MELLKGLQVCIVEDEFDIAELVKVNFELEGARVHHFETGEKFLQWMEQQVPDLLILDLMLPGMSGQEVCRQVREKKSSGDLPIVILSAKGTDEDIVSGIEQGADDYVTKPFSPRVLVAKATAVLKRCSTKEVESKEVIEKFEIKLHTGHHQVFVNDEKVELRKIEFKILQCLISRPGWVFTRSQIVDSIHGKDYAVTDRSVDFQIVGLRKKLGTAGSYIETVRGIGYRFKE